MKKRLYRVRITTVDGLKEKCTTSDRDVLKAIEDFNRIPEYQSINVEYVDYSFSRNPLLFTVKGGK